MTWVIEHVRRERRLVAGGERTRADHHVVRITVAPVTMTPAGEPFPVIQEKQDGKAGRKGRRGRKVKEGRREGKEGNKEGREGRN